ncbi:MAG: hypothetical protein PHY82_02725 [Lentisphaeria bacterium]|nr:hypothetical protein [Lentisphaeria bacterium]
MIDLHCHILCNLDDGPDCMEETVSMALRAVNDGIHTIVATPHTLNGVYENSFARVARAVMQTQEILNQKNIPLKLAPGGENHLCAGLSEKIRNGDGCFINANGKYALVEFPFHMLPVRYKEELFAIRLQGIVPIIAHPERSIPFQQDPELLAELVAMGCLVQLTAMSVTGEFGEQTMRCAHGMLKQGTAHVIASDAHSSGNRAPVLSLALEAAADVLKNKALARTFFFDHPRGIIEGKELTIQARPNPDARRMTFPERIKAFLGA